jgi:hypothetical protein
LKFFIVCPRGLELPLYEEITHLLETANLDGEENLKPVLSSAHLGAVPNKTTGGI